MATGDLTQTPDGGIPWRTIVAERLSLRAAATDALQALASLRLTVALFSLSIFLVFVGTLAQVDHDVWHVVNETYFRVWIAQVELRAFGRLIGMFTEFDATRMTAWFPFPGGKLIGFGLAANLLAAHAIRFKTAAKGRQLTLGLGIIAAGTAATVAVIVSGMDNAVESELSPEFCNALWQTLRALLAGSALFAVYWVASKWRQVGIVEWLTAATLAATLAGSAAFLLLNPEWQLNPSGLRILWQLTKCSVAAAVLLGGCFLVFKKRAGIVLLHAGVGMLLASELVTDLTANEARMSIAEGQTASYTYDIRNTELAIVDRTSSEADRVVVVPQSMLADAAYRGTPITHPDLPFDVRVVEFLSNSNLKTSSPKQTNPATAGVGVSTVAVPVRSVNGITAGGGVNLPSAYVEFLDKQSGESSGVYLVSSLLDRPEFDRPGQKVGKYDAALRFKREPKPYSITLNEFRFDRYVGTNTAKNYSSDVRLVDNNRSIDREFRISMNNPLRYAGDTLYQADFDKRTEKTTVLQVVTNRGWMLPYVSLMVVGFGMLAQFAMTLGRFVNRRADEEAKAARKLAKQQAAAAELGVAEPGIADSSDNEPSNAGWTSPRVWFPVVTALVMGGYLLGKARPPADEPLAMQVHEFGALPLAEGGRVKPYDTLARTTLQFLSARQEVELADGAKLPAITWMLDAITGKPIADSYRVFRLENLDLIDTLGLEARPGSFRYSYDELLTKADELGKQLDLAGRVPEEQRTVFQKKVGELGSRFIAYNMLLGAFGQPLLGSDPSTMQAELAAIQGKIGQLRRGSSARSVPPAEIGGEWLTLYEAEFRDLVNLASQRERNPATIALSDALTAYRNDDRRGFNEQVRTLQGLMAQQQAELRRPENAPQLAGLALAERLNLSTVRFETFFTAFNAFYYCAACYVVAFVLAAASWLGWSKPLSRASTAVIVVTFLVHTFAVVGRIYISGRPPVTNLYSSAIFIGWAAVLFGLLFEALYRIGIGNIVASVIGFLTLVVAHQLSLDGDTFTVMQAVLDTQFWLATHVVTVTLGYSTTFLAGLLGAIFLIGGHATGKLSRHELDKVTRMIYGVVCFSMLFSFVGTVLGGLWADDSWGRFWGWDPKENGALIIVLWNALILHARWGKMIAARGLATLAVLGNIVTTWSWFGVNELGVGLHAYGASERATAQWLLIFAASQLVVASLALLPAANVKTSRRPPAPAASAG